MITRTNKLVVSFYYKGCIVATRATDQEDTKEGHRVVTRLLSSGVLKKPENWDRYTISLPAEEL